MGFLSNSSARDLDFEPLYDDRLICIAPPDYKPRRPGVVRAEELRGQPFVSQQSDVDADIQSYFKKNDLHVSSQCYIVDDQSMIAMVACGQGLALMPELMFKEGAASAGCQVLQLEPAAKRSIGLACLSRSVLSPRRAGVCEPRKAVCKTTERDEFVRFWLPLRGSCRRRRLMRAAVSRLPVNGILRELCPSSGAARHLPLREGFFVIG